MAERRMFTQKVIESDPFLDMPLTAQALYIHLTINADDDGFVNGSKKIQRAIGAAPDDLNILIENGFVIGFASGVVVITHWKMHNSVRKDRYSPTIYQKELALLALDENNCYTVSGSQTATTWQPSGNQPATNRQPPDNQPATTWQPTGNHLATI